MVADAENGTKVAFAEEFMALDLLGALIYYISTATGFWVGVLGVLKAIVWPAMLIYHALKFFGM